MAAKQIAGEGVEFAFSQNTGKLEKKVSLSPTCLEQPGMGLMCTPVSVWLVLHHVDEQSGKGDRNSWSCTSMPQHFINQKIPRGITIDSLACTASQKSAFSGGQAWKSWLEMGMTWASHPGFSAFEGEPFAE
jgi:hypothetical protein